MKSTFPDITTQLETIDTIISRQGDRDEILQEVCQLLVDQVEHYDWVGFYLVDDSKEHLVLGPYVGDPTDHTKIAFGKGVCGQVAVSEMSRIIQDVSLEDNYLSCSANVKSEVVFPVMKDGKFVAELDIDSHAMSPFTDQDTELLEAVCEKLASRF